MTWKKITLTDAIVDDIALYLGREYLIPGRPEVTTYPPRADTMDAWRIITAVLSHPDAPGLFADEDARPWEPLNGRAPRVGDEVRRDRYGITSTAVVGRVDRTGDPWTSDGALIGMLSHGTWYVRRAAQPTLPTADGAVIVPADGHEFIETRTGKKSRRLTWDAESYVWYDARGMHLHGDITPGTWQLA